MFNIEIFHKNLERLRKLSGLGKIEFSELIGVANAYRKDIHSVGDQLWLGIKSNFSVPNKEWLIVDHDEANLEKIIFTSRKADSAVGLSAAFEGEVDFVSIPQVSGRISAGASLAPENDVDVRVAFRKAWIRKKGSPDKMSLIKVKGDSMEPTLLSGDMILVDHSKNVIDPQGGIYAIVIDDMIMLKRLQVLGQGRIRVVSDNPRYESIEVHADALAINGKVLWYCRELER